MSFTIRTIQLSSIFVVLCALCVEATEKCVWASGIIRCLKRPDINVGLVLTLLDRDGAGMFQRIDKDDMMG